VRHGHFQVKAPGVTSRATRFVPRHHHRRADSFWQQVIRDEPTSCHRRSVAAGRPRRPHRQGDEAAERGEIRHAGQGNRSSSSFYSK